MSESTRRGLKAIEAALLLGVVGDGLLRGGAPGLNVLLWTGALVVAALTLLGRRGRARTLQGGGHLLLLSALLFAACFAWRDSPTLNFLAGSGLLVSLALMAWRSRAGRVRLAGITEYLFALVSSAGSTFFAGTPMLLGMDVRWKELPLKGWTGHAKGIGLGLVMAVPLLILFGGLFAAADEGFQRMVESLFMDGHDQLFGHIFLALALAWAAGGFLRGLLFGREVSYTPGGRATFAQPAQGTGAQQNAASAPPIGLGPEPYNTEPVRLGIVEVGVAMGLLNLLFLAFVLTQLRYLFGGASLVMAEGGPTFSEYYRRGFFELVWVAALVLPLLLGGHWLLRKENPLHERLFRWLAGAQVLLLFVIMASAVRRMLLYQSVYGLTELRLYTTAFIVWLGLVFVWFAATALRGRREQFAFGALVAALLVVATLHVINPDAFIVRVNVAHAQASRGFDARYAASLSADAAPELLNALPQMKEDERRVIAGRLLEVWLSDEGADWRGWNWARSRRLAALDERSEELRGMAALPQTSAPLTSQPSPAEVGAAGGQSVPASKPSAQTKSEAARGRSAGPAQRSAVRPGPPVRAGGRPLDPSSKSRAGSRR